MYLVRLMSQPERKLLIQLDNTDRTENSPGWIQLWGIERGKESTTVWLEIGRNGSSTGLWDDLKTLDPHLLYESIEQKTYIEPLGYLRDGKSESLMVKLMSFPPHKKGVIPEVVFYDSSGYQTLSLVEDGGFPQLVVRGSYDTTSDWVRNPILKTFDGLVELTGPKTQPFNPEEDASYWFPIYQSGMKWVWVNDKGNLEASVLTPPETPKTITLLYPNRNLSVGSKPDGRGALVMIVKGKSLTKQHFRIVLEAIATSNADGAISLVASISPRLMVGSKTLKGEVILGSANQCGSVGSFQIILDFPPIMAETQAKLQITSPDGELVMDLGEAGKMEQAGLLALYRLAFYDSPNGKKLGLLEKGEVVADVGKSGNAMQEQMQALSGSSQGIKDRYVLENYEEVIAWREIIRLDGSSAWVQLQIKGNAQFIAADFPESGCRPLEFVKN
jgi:hypothetical protein